jgi:hypothetical protein
MSNGYGVIRIDGRLRPAHVYAYEQVHGPVPAGHQLDHRCRTRDCVNPNHTEPVIHAENGRRGAATKLTHEQAREVARRRRTGERCASIAAVFGIAENTVSHIARGVRWKGVVPS